MFNDTCMAHRAEVTPFLAHLYPQDISREGSGLQGR